MNNINILLSRSVQNHVKKHFKTLSESDITLLISIVLPTMTSIISNYDDKYIFGVFIGIATVYYIINNWKKNKPKHKRVAHPVYKLEIYDMVAIRLLCKYMKINSGMFKNFELESCNPTYCNSIRLLNYFEPINESSISFTDTNYNVSGTINVEEIEKKGSETYVYYKKFILSIPSNNKMTPTEYMDNIKEWLTEYFVKQKKYTLYFRKFIGEGGETHHINAIAIHKGEKGDEEKRYKEYIHSYFSPKRDEIWNMTKMVHFNPEIFRKFGQIASMNFIFHGPPGTGKSTLARRLAIATGRHLVSLNFIDFIHHKTTLYETLNGITIYGDYYTPEKLIFLLEEFDTTVKYMDESGGVKNYMDRLAHFNSWYSSPQRISIPEEKQEEDSENPKEEKKEKKESKPLSSSGNQLGFGDLLEILQGSVPREGSIIIATTNHFDYIKEKIPALVRPGRLTPIEVGYLDWTTFQQLTQYYFGGPLTCDPFDIKYPTSGIIDDAMKCISQGHSVEEFQKIIQEKNKIYTE